MSDTSREKAERVPAGMWGGAHVRMEVKEHGAEIEYDCAHGTLDAPLALDGEGRFGATGAHVREGGHIRLGVTPQGRAVRYCGRVSGQTMTLSVKFADSGEELGPFTLTRGSAGRLWKCR